MKVEWSCDGCPSVVRLDGNDPLVCFTYGVIAGLRIVGHRTRCRGSHYEDGEIDGPSLEAALVGTFDGMSWEDLEREAVAKANTNRGAAVYE